MKPRLKRQTPARILATRQFQQPTPDTTRIPSIPPTASIWDQWGAALVEQYPREEWTARLLQVPEFYRGYVRSRLIRDHGFQVEVTV